MVTSDIYQVYDMPIMGKYMHSIHASVYFLLGSDCMPRNSFQTLVGCFGIFFGAIINANIFGELAVIMGSMGKVEKDFQVKLAQTNSVMITLQLPEKV